MKSVLAVIAGLIAAVVVIYGLEFLSTILFPLPEGADPTNIEWIKENAELIPTGSMIIVALAHLLGIIVGMVIAAKVAGMTMIPSYIVGILLLVGTLLNLIMIPHPFWFAATDLIGVVIGLGIGKVFAQKQLKRA
ncbi:MAG: hypothetical protein KJO49_06340 [Bacteroidia bacterium]|nr:hypothetical protein [Bacteroidia bacterium]